MLYDHIGIPKTECLNLVESVLEIIKSELEKGNTVMVSGSADGKSILRKHEKAGTLRLEKL